MQANKGKAVMCRNCNRLLGYFKVLVGEIKCSRCNHVAEYHVLTESFMHAVQEGEHYMAEPNKTPVMA